MPFDGYYPILLLVWQISMVMTKQPHDAIDDARYMCLANWACIQTMMTNPQLSCCGWLQSELVAAWFLCVRSGCARKFLRERWCAKLLPLPLSPHHLWFLQRTQVKLTLQCPEFWTDLIFWPVSMSVSVLWIRSGSFSKCLSLIQARPVLISCF